MTTPPPNVPPIVRQPDSTKRSTWITILYMAVGASACFLYFLTVIAVTFSMPKVYTSQIRIQIGSSSEGGAQNPPAAAQADSSALLQAHAQALRSEPVLRRVVDGEKLAARWTTAESEPMTAEKCVDLLRRRTESRLIRGTDLIELVAYSTDPREAAQIANRFGEVYCDFAPARTPGGTRRVAEKAVPAAKPSFPNIPRTLGIGFLGAALLGAIVSGFLFLLDWAIRRLTGASSPPRIPKAAGRRNGANLLIWIVGGCLSALVVAMFIKSFQPTYLSHTERKPAVKHSGGEVRGPTQAEGIPQPEVKHAGEEDRVPIQVTGMPQGAYSKKMFALIGKRWTQLLDQNYSDGQPGHVKFSFTLHPTGSVDHMKVVSNTASPVLETYCQKAVLECAPFDPWPEELQQSGSDHLDITIDFNVYLYEDQHASGEAAGRKE